MKHLILIGIASLALVACDSDKKKNAGVAPVRTADHKAADCPADIAGVYASEGDMNDLTEILLVNGVLIVRSPGSGDLPVDGSVHTDKTDGSSNSIICQAGKLELVSVEKDGKKWEISVAKSGKDLKVTNKTAGETITMVRVGGVSVQPEPIEIPALPENPQDRGGWEMPQMPETPQMPEMPSLPEEAKQCTTGTIYSYRLNTNGCDTGQHTLCSKPEYCAALQNDALNNGCSKASRDERYARDCK